MHICMLYTKAQKLIKRGKRTKRKEQCITLRIAVEIARSDFFIEGYTAYFSKINAAYGFKRRWNNSLCIYCLQKLLQRSISLLVKIEEEWSTMFFINSQQRFIKTRLWILITNYIVLFFSCINQCLHVRLIEVRVIATHN